MTKKITKKEIPEICGDKTIRMICDYKHRKLYHTIFSVLFGLCSLGIFLMACKEIPTPFSTVFFMTFFWVFIPIFVFFSYAGYYLYYIVHYYFRDRKKMREWVKKNPNDERVKWMTFKYHGYAFS